MKKDRAREIAHKLNNIKIWNSHGLGINMQRLRRELKLHIDDFGKNKNIRILVRDYHKLALDYALKMGFDIIIQSKNAFEGRRLQ